MRIILCWCLLIHLIAADDTSLPEADDKALEQQVAVQAVYLGVNENLIQESETIVILQIVSSNESGDLASDQIVLCHWDPQDKTAFEVDRAYRVVLSKKNTPSAVSWVMESAEELKEEAELQTAQEISAQSIDVAVLDGGSSWLLRSVDIQAFRNGAAQLHILDLEMIIKVTITANDGRFLIIKGPQLPLLHKSGSHFKQLQLQQ